MPNYELISIMNPELSEEDMQARLGRISQFITERGGEQVKVLPWGPRRRLAYEIGRFREGVYVTHDFTAPAAAIGEVERQLRLMDDVVRHLTIRKPDAKTPRPPRKLKRQPASAGGNSGGGTVPFQRPAPQPAPAPTNQGGA